MNDKNDSNKKPKTQRFNKKTKMKNFIKELAGPEAAGAVLIAAERAGISRDAVYRWRKEDVVFEAEWDDAVVAGEKHILTLATSSLVNLLRQQHPTITIFALKNKDPDNWKDRQSTEDLTKPIEPRNLDEYYKQCEREGLDPKTGLPKNPGSSSVESVASVPERP